MFSLTDGKLNHRQRKQAMKVTGLQWIQIYKWIFDKKVRDDAHKR